MISRFGRDSCLWRFSSCLPSPSSISLCTRLAAVVKTTEIFCWQAARPIHKLIWVLPVQQFARGDQILPELYAFAAAPSVRGAFSLKAWPETLVYPCSSRLEACRTYLMLHNVLPG